MQFPTPIQRLDLVIARVSFGVAIYDAEDRAETPSKRQRLTALRRRHCATECRRSTVPIHLPKLEG